MVDKDNGNNDIFHKTTLRLYGEKAIKGFHKAKKKHSISQILGTIFELHEEGLLDMTVFSAEGYHPSPPGNKPKMQLPESLRTKSPRNLNTDVTSHKDKDNGGILRKVYLRMKVDLYERVNAVLDKKDDFTGWKVDDYVVGASLQAIKGYISLSAQCGEKKAENYLAMLEQDNALRVIRNPSTLHRIGVEFAYDGWGERARKELVGIEGVGVEG